MSLPNLQINPKFPEKYYTTKYDMVPSSFCFFQCSLILFSRNHSFVVSIVVSYLLLVSFFVELLWIWLVIQNRRLSSQQVRDLSDHLPQCLFFLVVLLL